MVSHWLSVLLSILQSVCLAIFSFPDTDWSKRQWIFAKLGMCIDIVEIWSGIANGQISSIFNRVTYPSHNIVSLFDFFQKIKNINEDTQEIPQSRSTALTLNIKPYFL